MLSWRLTPVTLATGVHRWLLLATHSTMVLLLLLLLMLLLLLLLLPRWEESSVYLGQLVLILLLVMDLRSHAPRRSHEH